MAPILAGTNFQKLEIMIKAKQIWLHKKNSLQITILHKSYDHEDHWYVGLNLSDLSGTTNIMTCHIHKNELLESDHWHQAPSSTNPEA